MSKTAVDLFLPYRSITAYREESVMDLIGRCPMIQISGVSVEFLQHVVAQFDSFAVESDGRDTTKGSACSRS